MPRTLVLPVALVLLGTCAGPLSGQVLPGEIDALVTAHDVVRSDFGVPGRPPWPLPYLPPMVWSAARAATAQAWASACLYGHSGTPGAGENVYASSPSRTPPAQVVASWASEVAWYHYATSSCSAPTPPGTCGHYTQIVWRTSTQLGCGVAQCSAATSPFDNGEPWWFWVCQYSPPGNVVGQRPYLCDYDGDGTTTHLCDARVVFTDGFEWGSTLAWSG